MSKKRKEWIDALMTGASLIGITGLVLLGRLYLWPIAVVFVGIAALLTVVSGIVYIGWSEFIALPQAMIMAIQDRRRTRGNRKRVGSKQNNRRAQDEPGEAQIYSEYWL